MTAPAAIDPHTAFLDALPVPVRRSLNVTQAVVALVHAAVTNHGWTPRHLAQECSRDLEGVVNAGAVVTDRLRKAAAHPPPNQPTKRTAARPLCGKCEDGFHVDPATRLPVARCDCRTTPATKGPAR